MDSRPIGIFDSGYGGLTVLKEVRKTMPEESLIYFGDSKNAPYGQYSEEKCIELAKSCADRLLEMDCKALIVACNLMSGIALGELQKTYDVPITGMITAGAEAAGSKCRDGEGIGVIGTPLLMNKGIYQRKIAEKRPGCFVQGVGTPELVPLIERGVLYGHELKTVLEKHRDEFVEQISVLVLGCTHYPIISRAITEVFGAEVTLINPAEWAANQMKKELEKKDILCEPNTVPFARYYTSADAPEFKKFMSEVMNIESNEVYSTN